MTRFLAVGHVSRDELPDGTHRLGGTALYAAATAARLGARTSLVTRVGPNERSELERICTDLGIDLRPLGALATTTFAFHWDGAGRRVLRLRSRAKAIGLADIPSDLRAADALVLGSIARELGADLLADRAAPVVVLAAQGLLRAWNENGKVRPAPWPDAASAISGVSAVVLSIDDVAGDTREVERWSDVVPVVVTLAERGARLYEHGKPVEEIGAFAPVRVVDTTGAGDTFAAALALALSERRDLRAACAFANAVASFGLEGEGISGLAGRDAVERRLAG